MSLAIARIGLIAQGVVDWANRRLGSEPKPIADTRSSWDVFRDSLDAGNTVGRLYDADRQVGLHVDASDGDLKKACALLLRKRDINAFIGEHHAPFATLAAATVTPDMLGEGHVLCDILGRQFTMTLIHRVAPSGKTEIVGGSTG